jgi:hypothetical protein
LTTGSDGSLEKRPGNETLGFRRSDFIRITVGDGAPRAVLVSVVHRLAREVPITIRMANRLARAGVPLVVREVAEGDQHPASVRRGWYRRLRDHFLSRTSNLSPARLGADVLAA